MFVLLGELNFWTFDNDVSIKETDFGAFSYHDKKIENVYEEGKKSYAQKRGMVYVPQNKKGNKLKDSIKYLEEQLSEYSTVYCQWFDYCTMQIMLSSGLLVYIQVDLRTGDIQKIVFDKYLMGKLSDRLSDAIITKNYLICTYNDCQVTLVNFLKPKKNIFEKIGHLDPKLSTFDLCGPSGRRLEKKIEHNRAEDLILIWWKSTMNEVYPWSPTVKEYDRANVHLYRLTGTKLELLCYLRTEFDPLCLLFNTTYNNVIHSLEQKVSRKGEVTVEWRTYEVSQNDKLQRIAVVSIPLPTHTSCVRFSPTQEMLLLCCIDGSITLHDQTKGTNNSTKAAFIPTLACWHSDCNIFAIGNERGQIQNFDLALNCIKIQMLSEDIAATNIVDLSSYFRTQPALMRLEWCKKSEPNAFVDYYNHGDALFLLLFERGPVAIVRVVEGANFAGDILVQRYLTVSQVQQATSLLLAMNWDTNPHVCMHSLNQIVNYLFKQPLTPDRENLIQNALGTFHVPVKPLNQLVVDEYSDEIRDLTRRFFHHLLRYRLFEKAFRLAIDLNDHDLFMDIHFYAIVLKDTEMAAAAKEKAQEIISRCNSCSSSHSTCSRPSCSICSDSGSERDESYMEDSESEESPRKEKIHVKRPSKHKYSRNSHIQAPPLPILYPPIYDNSGLMSTPFNELYKTETNLMSTSFNVPNCNTPSTSYNYTIPSLIPNSYLTTVPHEKSTAFSPLANSGYSQSMKSYDNLASPFRSLSIANQLTPSEAQSSLNSMSLENISSSYQIGNVASSTYNSASIEPRSLDTPVILTSSIDNSSSNVMTTSFSNRLSNPVPTSLDSVHLEEALDKNDTQSTGLTITRNSKPFPSQLSTPLQSLNTVIPTKSIATSVEPPSLALFNSGNNLMSTSFNDPEDHNDDTNSNSCESSTNSNSTSNQLHSINIPPPPPPLITDSLANYIHNLPKKNYGISKSTPGLVDINNSLSKSQHMKPAHAVPNFLHQQNSISNILQNHQRHSNFQSTRKYQLDYDLDYVPFHNSCDNLITTHSSINHVKSNSYSIPSKHESRSFKLAFSQSSISDTPNRDHKLSSNIPPLPVINNTPAPVEKTSSLSTTTTEVSSVVTEKPKVKFSDTVTHILVPNSSSVNRPVQKKTVTQMHSMDPKRELAESLPLCLGNEDYLKDFQPLSKDECDEKQNSFKKPEPAKIKVVHFGLL